MSSFTPDRPPGIPSVAQMCNGKWIWRLEDGRVMCADGDGVERWWRQMEAEDPGLCRPPGALFFRDCDTGKLVFNPARVRQHRRWMQKWWKQ